MASGTWNSAHAVVNTKFMIAAVSVLVRSPGFCVSWVAATDRPVAASPITSKISDLANPVACTDSEQVGSAFVRRPSNPSSTTPLENSLDDTLGERICERDLKELQIAINVLRLLICHWETVLPDAPDSLVVGSPVKPSRSKINENADTRSDDYSSEVSVTGSHTAVNALAVPFSVEIETRLSPLQLVRTFSNSSIVSWRDSVDSNLLSGGTRNNQSSS